MDQGALGAGGTDRDRVLDLLSNRKKATGNMPWRGPRMLRPSYFAGEDVLSLAQEAFRLFISENWLYSRTSFPVLGALEDEVLTSLRTLFQAPGDAGGILTSGGTESLLLAVKIPVHRARATKAAIRAPNIVLPWNAHPALDKAAELLAVEVRRAPPSDQVEADVDWMANACDDDTVLLVGSAPPYPFGVIDPLAALSRLAQERDIWLHVDACLGGMILPFLEAAGRRPEAFDFALPGVKSISVDLHKFGFAVKGISAIMLRETADATYAKTTFSNWPAGLYGTPAVSGTRSGGALASAWAVMRYLGRSGYAERVARILAIRDEFIEALGEIGGRVIGEPPCFHFAFAVEGVDSLLLAAELGKTGWYLGAMERPAAVQVMINAGHEGVAASFAAEVATIAEDIRAGRRTAGSERAVYSM